MLLDQFLREGRLSKMEYAKLLNTCNKEQAEQIRIHALKLREDYYGKKVFVRGLIEFTNYCKNQCYYCGIRCENQNVVRYRLSLSEIMECCEEGYHLGFRTFVLQGGEDPFFTESKMEDIIRHIRTAYPDCAITLSLGEKDLQSYRVWKDAGADRYLLRHETANKEHYRFLHPDPMTLENRKKCLYQLKELGYQTGAGFMVGSPGQTNECLGEDLEFLQELNPQMVGIGPFIPHRDTPFSDYGAGSLEKTLLLLSIVRMILPRALLPATTALGTVDPLGREKGILAGANVVMPNLSPISFRKQYELYNNKICTGEEAAESITNLKKRMQSIGYEIVTERGDALLCE